MPWLTPTQEFVPTMGCSGERFIRGFLFQWGAPNSRCVGLTVLLTFEGQPPRTAPYLRQYITSIEALMGQN